MKIVIAPDSFKGTLSSLEVCLIIEKAFREKIENIEIIKLPAADGGEGLCASVLNITGGETVSLRARGVFSDSINTHYIITPDNTAVIETASCAGLVLAGENKNPMKATTFGVGEQIMHAHKRGVKEIVLGLGGSATNDCGIGMAAAMGYSFLDENGNPLEPAGASMISVKHIRVPEKAANIKVIAACDVDNPLYGEKGAAHVFAPQKGADEKMVRLLDDGLRNMASVIHRDLGIRVDDIPGAGAAGGMGAGVAAFLKGSLCHGIELLLNMANFEKLIKNADFVITGEGKLDSQSAAGKAPFGIMNRAKKAGIPTVGIFGIIDKTAQNEAGEFFSVYAATEEALPLCELQKSCRASLYQAAWRAAEELKRFSAK